MHRTIRSSELPKFVAAVERQALASERLMGRPDPIENCDFEEAEFNAETEPAE
jgi:hypothetical protein